MPNPPHTDFRKTKRQKLSPEQSQALEQQQKQELAGKIAGLKAEIDYLQKRETGLKNLKQVVIGSNTSLEKGLAKEKMDPASDKRNLEAW